ncbi:MAG: type II secretion system protein N [Burkholderiales bacterium]|nr:type II secretion system protein N [Burkholderiales bacterium]MDE2075683.1 type II secretion system protein N [Burkholderiales bacterium]MDE2432116.1 type II secretion system protein N [Burkholderiales bacterium]
MRKAGKRWGKWGVALGAVLGLILFAPATWLAQSVENLTGGRLLLAEAQGTVWQGDAVAILTGGPGSRDAKALPGRLGWRIKVKGLGLRVSLQQDCCMPTPVVLDLLPGWGRLRAELKLNPNGNEAELQASGAVGHWPAAWLGGLGTPWNTLQLGGLLRLNAQQLSFEWVEGRLRMSGQADFALDNVTSPITTLDRLGSYRLDVLGDAQGQMQLNLTTLEGSLLLTGQGTVGAGGTRFRGDARAVEADRGALDNLLNIIGRRSGDHSVILIG